MNALKTLSGVLQSKYLGRPVPVAMTIALTYRCNLRCRYCQIWKEADRELTTGQVIQAIDELTDAGMARLGLTGGEPLLRDDIGTLVEHAKGKGLFVSIFTNGALAEKNLDTLKKCDVVLTSFDGPKEVHDAMRGRGAWDGAMNGIRLMSAAGIKLWTNTVVTNKNAHVVDFVVETARKYGAHCAFQPIFEHSYSVDSDKVAGYRVDKDEYNRVINHLLDLKNAGAPILTTPPFFNYVREPNWETNARHCLAAKTYGAVAPDGSVAPCPVLLQNKGLPNGLELGFAEAFRRTQKPTSCHGCFCIATVESDFLFALEPGSLMNTTRYLVDEKVRQIKGLFPKSSTDAADGESYHASVMDYPDCSPSPCEVTSDRDETPVPSPADDSAGDAGAL